MFSFNAQCSWTCGPAAFCEQPFLWAWGTTKVGRILGHPNLCHPHPAESQGTHSHYRDGGVSTLVSLFFPIAQNSLYLVPAGVFPHEQELFHSVIWERPRDQGHGSAHWWTPSVYIRGSLGQTWHSMECLSKGLCIYRPVGVILNNLTGNPTKRLGWTQCAED